MMFRSLSISLYHARALEDAFEMTFDGRFILFFLSDFPFSLSLTIAHYH